MPDFFSNLNATGIGQIPDSSNPIAPLPKIDFSELPTYNVTPYVANTGGLPVNPFEVDFKTEAFSKATPVTADSNDLAKIKNSSAFGELGYNKYETPEAQENKYDQAQPWWESAKNASVKLADKTWSSFTSFFKQNVDTVSSLSNLNIADAWKTDANLAALEHDKEMENLYPSFSGSAGKRWYSFIPGTTGSGDFYEQFVPQLGFTLGMMAGAVAENVVVDFFTGGLAAPVEGVNTARKLYGAITGFSNLKKGLQLAEGITKGTAAVDSLKVGANLWAFYNTIASESSMEGGQSYNETKNDLIEQYRLEKGYKPGGEDLARIEKLATDAGTRTFATNLPILGVSNAIQFESILFPTWAKAKALKADLAAYEFINQGAKLESKFIAQRIAEDSFSTAWKTANAATRTKMLGSWFADGKFAFVTEGFEEIAQRAASSGSKDYAINSFYGKEDGIKSIKHGISDIFTSDGLQEFIGGALGGLLFQGTGHFASRFANPKTTINAQGEEETKYGILNRMGIYSDAYKEGLKAEKANKIAEAISHDNLVDVLKDEGFKNLVLAGKSKAEMKKYLENNDIFNAENIKSDALNRFFYSALASGKIDLRIGQINDFTSLTDDEFRQQFNIDPSTEAKESLEAIAEHIQARAATFEDVYNREGARFNGQMKEAWMKYKLTQTAYKSYFDTLAKKYGTDDADLMFKSINDQRDALFAKLGEARKIADVNEAEIAVNDVLKELDNFNNDNADILKDQKEHDDLNKYQNDTFIDYVAVEEGKKAALFAYSDMIDSADRARKIVNDLNRSGNGIRYTQVNQILDKVSAANERRRIAEIIRNYDKGEMTAQGRKEQTAYKKQLEALDKLLQNYAGDNKTDVSAELIHDFLLEDPLISKNSDFYNALYTNEKKDADLKQLTDLTALQRRHQENLNLYNRLSDPAVLSEHNLYVSDTIKAFIQRAYDYHKGKEARAAQAAASIPVAPVVIPPPPSVAPTPTPNNPVAPQSPVNPAAPAPAIVIPAPEVSTQAQPATNTVGNTPTSVEQFAAIVTQKANNGEPFTVYEYTQSAILSAVNEDIKTALDKEELRRANAAPQTPVPVKELPENKSAPVVEPTTFVPDLQEEATEVAESEYTAKAIEDLKNPDPLRTKITETDLSIVEQIEEPILDPETQFRQNFLDTIVQDALINDYSATLEMDSLENYDPELVDGQPTSENYKYLAKHPEKFKLVLKINMKGRTLFDEFYQPSSKGKPLVFSMEGSPYKEALYTVMKAKGQTSIPVKLGKISPGAWYEGKNRLASELLSGISKGDYSVEVARSEKGDVKFPGPNGYVLRNGGLYIKARGSYIKLVPEEVTKIKLNGEVKDVLGLIGQWMDSNQANEVHRFLSNVLTLGYTNDVRLLIEYDQTSSKSRIMGYTHNEQTGDINDLSVDQTIAEIMKTERGTARMNVANALVGNTFTFYYMENGEVKSVDDVDYNDFILNNSYTRKKNYLLNGQKVVKPINRYLTLEPSAFKDAAAALSAMPNATTTQTVQPVQPVVQATQPTQTTPTQTVPVSEKTVTMFNDMFNKFKTFDFGNAAQANLYGNIINQFAPQITPAMFEAAFQAKDLSPIIQMMKDHLAGKPTVQVSTPINVEADEFQMSHASRDINKPTTIENIYKQYPFAQELINKYKIKVKILTNEEYEKENPKANSNGFYSAKGNLIGIKKMTAPKTLLHELVHGIAYLETGTKTSEEFKKTDIGKRLVEFTNQVTEELDRQKAANNGEDTVEGAYIRQVIDRATNTNVQEILTYGLTGTAFAEWLAKIPAKNPIAPKETLFDRFVNVIKSVIKGIVPNSMLDQLHSILLPTDAQELESFNNLMNSPVPTQQSTQLTPQQEATTQQAPYGTIAADYLFTAGVGTIKSTDYFLQGLSGAFTKASIEIETIRNKYAQELADKKLTEVKDFNGTLTFGKIEKELRDVINEKYIDIEGVRILNQILKHTSGLPTKLGQELSIKLDDLHTFGAAVVTLPDMAEFDEMDESEADNLRNRLDRRKTNALESVLGESEVKWLLDTFGKQAVRQLKDIVDSDAWGTWLDGMITLYSDAPAGTGYHEAWHHFSQLYLTPDQKTKLYNEVRELVSSLAGVSSMEVEEYIAEDFRKFMQGSNEIAGRPVRNDIFQKIANFIRKFLQRFGIGTTNLNTLYSQLSTGDVQFYKPSMNNAMFGKLNSRVVDSKGRELLTPTKATRYMRYMDSLIGQFIADKQVTFAMFGIKRKDTAGATVRAAKAFVYNKMLANYKAISAQEAADIVRTGKATPKSETIADLYFILKKENYSDIFKSYMSLSDFDLNKLSDKDLDKALKDTDPEAEEVGLGEDEGDNVDKEELDEADNGAGWRDSSGNQISLINDASNETKALIRTLSKVAVKADGSPDIGLDGKVKLFTNEYGLTEPVNFSQLFNNLGILLEGSYNEQEMLDKLRDEETQRRLPEVALLLERLPQNTTALNFPELQTYIKFFKDFSKVYIPIYSLVKMNDGSFIFKEQTKNSKDQITKQWANNFFERQDDNPYILSGEVVRDINKRPKLNNRLQFNWDFSKPEQRLKFLDLLGFSFSPLSISSSEFAEATTEKEINILAKSVRQRLAAGQSMYKPISDLNSKFKTKGGDVIMDENRILKNLVNVEAKYSNVTPSMSFRDSQGNMKYGLSLNMWLTGNNYWLSRTTDYKKIIDSKVAQHLNIYNNPGVKNSILLNAMFELDPNASAQSRFRRKYSNGQPVTLEIGNYDGISYEDNKKKGKSTTSLTAREKVIMDINSLLTTGAVEIMRTESSASAYFVRLTNFTQKTGTKMNLPFAPETMRGNIDSLQLRKVFTGYFEDEINTVINKFNSPLPNYYGKAESPGRFSMFETILNTGMEEGKESDLLKRLKAATQEGIDAKNATPDEKQAITQKILTEFSKEVMDTTVAFLKAEVASFDEYLRSKQINAQDITNKFANVVDKTGNPVPFAFTDLLNAFIVNDFVLNVEFSKLFSGNVAYYKAYHKRSKGDVSTGHKPITSPLIEQWLNDSKKKTLAYALGNTGDVDLVHTKTMTIKDDERASVYTDHLIQALKDVNPGISTAHAEKLLGKRLKEDGSIKKDIAYNNINVADGQGHCTIDFYRSFRIRTGTWSQDDELAYEREVIGYKLRKQLFATQDEVQAALIRYEDLLDIKVYWPPVKMQHNGPLDIKGSFTPVLDKFSIAPLIPSMINGKVWDDLHDNLVKSGVEYTKMKSGSKKYAFPDVSMYNEDWTASIDSSDKNTATVFSDNLKEQVATHGAIKSESTWGTQMRKLFMANLFSIGQTSNDKFAKIMRNYKDIMNKMVEGERKNLYKDFGIVREGSVLKIHDVKNFVETLQKQATTRKLNDNILDTIGYDEETHDFLYPLEINLNRAAIQDLIMGMIYNRMTRIKLNGDMLIQVASTGFEEKEFKYTNATNEDRLKYGTNGLPFYTMSYDKEGKPLKTNSMGIKVALAGEWLKLLEITHPDGKKIGTRLRLNQLLKNEDWVKDNEKKLTLIGYRIPTQGPNSMEFMKIAEFLPEIAGSIIILPAEITVKAGSDYDIDKMNIFRPSLDSKGNYISDAIYDTAEDKISTLEEQLEKMSSANPIVAAAYNFYRNSDVTSEEGTEEVTEPDLTSDAYSQEERSMLKSYANLKKNKKAYYTNKLIEMYHEVLSSPEMFTQLVTPNNTDLVEPLALELAALYEQNIKDFRDGNILKYLSNLSKFEQLTSGKRMLGVFALANNASQLFQQAGMTINNKYNLQQTIKENGIGVLKWIPKRVNLHLLSPGERKTVMTTAGPDGINFEIDFSSSRNVEGEFKQDYFSQLINSTVDIATNPYFVALGINNENVGVFTYMIHLNIPYRRAVLFLNQPILKRYYQMLETTPKTAAMKESLMPGDDSETIPYNTFLYEVEKVDNAAGESFFFSTEALEKIVFGDARTEFNKYAKNAQGAELDYQRTVFAHYVKLQHQADIQRNLQAVTNFDTNKFISTVSIESNMQTRQELSKQGLFNEAAVDRIMNDSLISAFNNLQETKDIFSRLMPVTNQTSYLQAASALLNGTRGTKADKIRMERVIANDWMEFIVKNYAEIDGKNFEDFALPLIQGDNTLSMKLYVLKNKYPELARKYSLLNLMYPNNSEKTITRKNIELHRGLDNTTGFQNILIEEYNKLLNFKGNEIPGIEYTQEQIEEIRGFFDQFEYASFQQSGFNRSFISSIDIVPPHNLARIFKAALKKYDELSNDKNNKPEGFKNFRQFNAMVFLQLFQRENGKFQLAKGPTVNQESWRGKTYKINSTGENNILTSQRAKDQNNDLDNEDQAPDDAQTLDNDDLNFKSSDEDFNNLLGCL